MSRKRGRGKGTAILYEARRRSLPPKTSHRSKINDDSLCTYDKKKTKQKIKLQLTLDNNPDKYDEHWIGDEMKDKKRSYSYVVSKL